MNEYPQGLADYFASRFASKVERVERLGPDDGGSTTAKAEGYGEPLKVTLRRGDGSRWTCVFHTASSNEFGHDRRSDRALQQLLAFDTFAAVPRHVRALDVGAISPEGLLSLADAQEHFLVTD